MTSIPTSSTPLNLPDDLPPRAAAKFRANPPEWWTKMLAETEQERK